MPKYFNILLMLDAQNVLLLCPKGVKIMLHCAWQTKLFLIDGQFDEFCPPLRFLYIIHDSALNSLLYFEWINLSSVVSKFKSFVLLSNVKYFCLAQFVTDLNAVRSQKSQQGRNKMRFFIRIGSMRLFIFTCIASDTKPLFHTTPKIWV